MDYASELEECYPEVEVSILSTEEVKRAIASLELWRPIPEAKIEDSLINGVKTCQNHLYLPTTITIRLDEPSDERFFQISVERVSVR
jgi:hypothetical protein